MGINEKLFSGLQRSGLSNVQSSGVIARLRLESEQTDGIVRIGVGFSANSALFLHEKKEMKWKGLPRGSMGGYTIKRKVDNEASILKGAIRFAKANAKYRTAKQREQAADPIQKELKKQIKSRRVVNIKGVIHRGYYWDPQGKAQPQFLVGPFREMRGELVEIIKAVAGKRQKFTRGRDRSLAMGLYAAGLRLQREAQQRVPVEFGFLKASAWTKRLS